MGLIGSVLSGVSNWATAPLRMGFNALKIAGNVLQIAGNILTLDGKNLKKNIGDLWDAGKGVAFAGVEAATGPVVGSFLGMVENGMRR